MMTKNLLIFSCLILFSFSALAQKGTLKIIIPEIQSNKGTIKVALYNTTGRNGFLKDLNLAFRKKEVAVKNKSAIVVFQNVPYGIYAVSLFQDENNNGKIDRAKIGFPIEPYGISGNKSSFGPPKFNDCKFEFNSVSEKLTINLKSF